MNPSEPIKCACGGIGEVTIDGGRIVLDCKSCGNHAEFSTSMFGQSKEELKEEPASEPVSAPEPREDGVADLKKHAETVFPGAYQRFSENRSTRALETSDLSTIEATVCSGYFSKFTVEDCGDRVICTGHGASERDYAISLDIANICNPKFANLLASCISLGLGETLVQALREFEGWEICYTLAFFHNNDLDDRFDW